MSTLPKPLQKIVLTGAPGSGKTTIARTLAEARPDRYLHVPEAATQTYTALMTRWDKLDDAGRRDAQLRIYALQVSQEAASIEQARGRVILLDRGTIDGAAYWPDGPERYWEMLQSSHARELSRYDLVLMLESVAALGQYDGDKSNSTRFESAQESLENAKVLEKLWNPHPNLIRIAATRDLPDKLAAVERAIDHYLAIV